MLEGAPHGATGQRSFTCKDFASIRTNSLLSSKLTKTFPLPSATVNSGPPPSWTVPTIERVAGQIPTVLASRTAGGELLRHSYGYAGSETDLLARGLISAVTLSAAKARILLRLLLAAGVPRDQVASCFEEAAQPAIDTDRRFP